MQKVSSYKCPQCSRSYKTLDGWTDHVKTMHPDLVPSDFTYAQYFYFLLTGKNHGSCIMCHKPTRWNESTMKYCRFCDNPKCKSQYREIFKKRMINTHDGKVHLLDDPEMQRKMLKGRKISGTYDFRDGGSVGFVGKYEKNFLEMLDILMGWNSADIIGPSPHNYYYDYVNPNDREHEGKKLYIPDFFIPTLNLEIEIEEKMNLHPQIIAINKVKKDCKERAMAKIKSVRYLRLSSNDFSPFFQLLEELKKEI